MRFKLISPLFFILFCLAVQAEKLFQKFDKAAFYSTLKSGNVNQINTELESVKTLPINEKDSYEGTLLMRKAGLVSIPAEKLKLFKAGRIKLETQLAKDSSNAEFRFMRLIIQEHAPKIVKYNKQLKTDQLFIQKSFKNLSPVVQQAIRDYSKESKVLLPKDL